MVKVLLNENDIIATLFTYNFEALSEKAKKSTGISRGDL